MHLDPFVSIIINCHNSDKYLKEAIDSVFNQTYKNWEIIFWDNNSSDNSAEIALAFSGKLRYFRNNSTLRLYAARNLAVEKADGKYIAFLDCDDIWTVDHLESLIGKLDDDCKFVYGGYDIINSSGNFVSEKLSYLPDGYIKNKLFRRNPISIGCVLVEKNLLTNNLFDSFYDLLGDFDLWLRLAENNRVNVVAKVIEHSRQHSKNLSKNGKERFLIERRRLYRKHISISNLLKDHCMLYYLLKTDFLGLFKS